MIARVVLEKSINIATGRWFRPRVMGWLEHRIPPPIVMVIIAGLMWFAHVWLGNDLASGLLFTLGLVFCAAGIGVAVAGFRTMVAARTSPSPTQIERAKHLVTDGIFTRTRNPMYLGMMIFLIGVECILANAWLLLGPLVFAFYIQRFQIEPEERVMYEKFGVVYDAYRKRVRRWF